MSERTPALEFIKRNWMSVALFAVLVFALPMATFYSRRLFTAPRQPDVAQKLVATVPTDKVYRSTQFLSMPIGSPSGIGVGLSTHATYVSFETVEPGLDGDVWLIDHPMEEPAGSRVRRFDDTGRLEVQFHTPPGTTLFTPGIAGDLWVDRSAGSSVGEVLMHYSSEGKLLQEIALPTRILAGSIEIDAKGRVFVGIAQYWVDPQTGDQRYSTELVPILDEKGVRIEDTKAATLPETFIGADGNYYSLEGGFQKGEAGDLPKFTVKVRDETGKDLRQFTVPKGLRPFHADVLGRLYAEERAADPVLGGQTVIGDEGGELSTIHVFDQDGVLLSSIPVETPLGITPWTSAASVDTSGVLYSTQLRDDRFLVIRTEEVEGVNGVAADAEPAPANARVIVTHERPRSADPYLAPDVVMDDTWRMVYSGLVSHDASLNAIPDLAQDVPAPGTGVSGDGKTITWAIRADRRWHDGKKVTAADVVATWKHLKAISPVVAGEPFPGFDLIESVTAEADKVTVRLSEPFGAAPECFFPYVLPAHLVSVKGSNLDVIGYSAPVGSGPYRVVRYEPDRWMLEVAEGAKVGAIERIDVEFKSTADSLDAYRNSTIPAIWTWAPSADLSDVERDAVGSVVAPETGRWFGTVFDVRDDLVADTAVRRALSAMHPLSGIRTLYGESPTVTVDLFSGNRDGGAGSASVAVTMPMASVRNSVSALAAKQASAPMKYRLPYAQTQRSQVNEVLKEQFDLTIGGWESVGLKHIENYAQATYYLDYTRIGYLSQGGHTIGAGVFPGFVDPGWGSVFDPSDEPSLHNRYGRNITHTDDAELLSLTARARASYDPVERAELGRAIQERAVELGLAIIERPERRNVAIRGLTGYRPGEYPAGDFWNVSDWRVE